MPEEHNLKKGYNYILAKTPFNLENEEHICFYLNNALLVMKDTNRYQNEIPDFEWKRENLTIYTKENTVRNFMVKFFKSYTVRKESFELKAFVIPPEMNEFEIKLKTFTGYELIKLIYNKQSGINYSSHKTLMSLNY